MKICNLCAWQLPRKTVAFATSAELDAHRRAEHRAPPVAWRRDLQPDTIRALRERGLSFEVIARMMHTTRKTVSQRLKGA